MTSLTLSIAMQMVLLGSAPGQETSYAKAHEVTTRTGRPLVVLVGAKWCPACVQMKNSVVPKLKERGALTEVSFAEVDVDQERALGQQLTKGGPIPQLLMYRKTRLGWRLRRVIGGQSVERVDRFIADGVALDKATKAQEGTASKQPNSTNTSSLPKKNRST